MGQADMLKNVCELVWIAERLENVVTYQGKTEKEKVRYSKTIPPIN